jgi:hypothetical protein
MKLWQVSVWKGNNEYKHKIQEEMQKSINIWQACHHSVQNNLSNLFPKIRRNERHRIMTAYLSVWQRRQEEMKDITLKKLPRHIVLLYILFQLARYSDYDSKLYFTMSTAVY